MVKGNKLYKRIYGSHLFKQYYFQLRCVNVSKADLIDRILSHSVSEEIMLTHDTVYSLSEGYIEYKFLSDYFPDLCPGSDCIYTEGRVLWGRAKHTGRSGLS